MLTALPRGKDNKYFRFHIFNVDSKFYRNEIFLLECVQSNLLNDKTCQSIVS
uniref:Uncharacterized protein n=1 Tax=Nelumbo nucifera TaxID=4432 RepID=A0A822YB96_NELNU|nr:TPA_asm: hypothetical protein HUJ06_010235 [Nelumbo nucifera]